MDREEPGAEATLDDENNRIPGGTPASPQIAQMLTIAPAMLIEKTRGLYPAPEAIMAAAVEGASVDFDTALRIESRYIAKLAVGPVAKNLITLFFNRTAIRSGASRPKDVPKWKATKVGILGAGMMGGIGCGTGGGNEDVVSGLVAMPALAAATASGASERPHSPQNCSPSLTSPWQSG